MGVSGADGGPEAVRTRATSLQALRPAALAARSRNAYSV
jgi:hypothetical protein